MNKIDIDITNLLNYMEKSQWTHKPNMDVISNMTIINRVDIQNMQMNKGFFTSKTSGSTGEPVTVQKTYLDFIWYVATNIREIIWRKWDVTKNIAIINYRSSLCEYDSWRIPFNIFPLQGKTFTNGYLPTSELQKWLEIKNPHYINCCPSILKQLDLSRLSNLIDCKGTGEIGGSMYSSEECGTIALNCPDNHSVKHVMENLIVEVDIDGSLIITSLTNPYIKRYRHGDHIEIGECNCGRTLQTIRKIKGRVRNMFILPNGDKKWPLFGYVDYYKEFGIKQFQAIQTSLTTMEMHIVSTALINESDFISAVKKSIDSPIDISIKYVNDFPRYKFEEFVSLVNQ